MEKIWYAKERNANKNNRLEFWIMNFDYIDGSDVIAKLFCRKYGMKADPKLEGIYFSIIKLHGDSKEYELLWHEDLGNVVYSNKQDERSNSQLEKELSVIIDELNILMEKSEAKD